MINDSLQELVNLIVDFGGVFDFGGIPVGRKVDIDILYWSSEGRCYFVESNSERVREVHYVGLKFATTFQSPQAAQVILDFKNKIRKQ